MRTYLFITLGFLFTASSSMAGEIDANPDQILIKMEKSQRKLDWSIHYVLMVNGKPLMDIDQPLSARNKETKETFDRILERVKQSAGDHKVAIDTNKLGDFERLSPTDENQFAANLAKFESAFGTSNQLSASETSCRKSMNDLHEIVQANKDETAKLKAVSQKLDAYFAPASGTPTMRTLKSSESLADSQSLSDKTYSASYLNRIR